MKELTQENTSILRRCTIGIALTLLMLIPGLNTVSAQTSNGAQPNFRYETRFYFHLDKYNIDESLNGNNRAIDSILYKISALKHTGGAKDIQLHLTSYTSLEASDQYNSELAAKRTKSLETFMKKFVLMQDVPVITDPNVFDWNTLIKMTRESNCPFKEEALIIMSEPEFGPQGNVRKSRLMQLGEGSTYKYMSENFFPLMRNSALTITATLPEIQVPGDRGPKGPDLDGNGNQPKERKKIHVALNSNLLYDVVTIGNLGADIYLGKNISVGGNWMYTWWKNDDKNFYWRAYGGEVRGDYWFNTNNNTNLWRGHHAGIYAQMLTFDVDLDDTGYLGPKWLYGGGIHYGYALGIGKRWALDFGIGIGYLTGKYYKYTPSSQRDIYLYQRTYNVNWFGPTSAKISLVWNLDL